MEYSEAFDISFVQSPVMDCCTFTLKSLTSSTYCTPVWAYVIVYCQLDEPIVGKTEKHTHNLCRCRVYGLTHD